MLIGFKVLKIGSQEPQVRFDQDMFIYLLEKYI